VPLYSYQCTTCGAHFDRAQSFDDRSVPACPNGHAASRRVFSPPTIIFKGAGFYSTDHRRVGKGKSSVHDS
jgi:putative FmdB family regulatory protein